MVKLPKEVADAIHYFQTKGREKSLFNIPTVASCSVREKRYKVIYDFIQVSDENFKKYFKALVDGYEVELTKEERLKEYFKSLKNFGSDYDKQLGILKALYVLGIEIKGVNK